jgi:hypothetical protein
LKIVQVFIKEDHHKKVSLIQKNKI